jgi:phage antirepressor YoqD-like protein
MDRYICWIAAIYYGLKLALDFTNPETALILAQKWKDDDTRKRLEEQLEDKMIELESLKVGGLGIDLKSEKLNSLGVAAKLMFRTTGRGKFIKMLRDDGILFKRRNEPIQQYVSRGYFTIKQIITNSAKEGLKHKVQIFVTQKGMVFLNKKYSELIMAYCGVCF